LGRKTILGTPANKEVKAQKYYCDRISFKNLDGGMIFY